MSFNEFAIRVEQLGKCYQIYDRPQDRLRQYLLPRLQIALGRIPSEFYREFWALKDVSFEIQRGETVGIIGRNGSGKSTLLQIICGTLTPTHGRVETRGRVAALLELGAGFNPEFTGRENVYMNGAILGLSSGEIDARFDEIASFADIGDFLEQPVKRYSSGMYARLAFAVAINVSPEILVVDEALSVGDEPFQRKCFARINQMRDCGCTILFVSHAGGTVVNLCDRAILLNQGRRLFTGIPKRAVFYSQQLGNVSRDNEDELIESIRLADSVGEGGRSQGIEIYEEVGSSSIVRADLISELLSKDEDALEHLSDAENVGGPDKPFTKDGLATLEQNVIPFFNANFMSQTYSAYEERGACIERSGLYTLGGEPVNHVVRGDRYILRWDASFDQDCPGVRFYTLIRTTEGLDLGGCAHPPLDHSGIDVEAGRLLTLEFEFECRLNPATYFCNFAIQSVDGSLHHRIVDALAFRVLSEGDSSPTGLIDLSYEVRVCDSSPQAFQL